MLPGSLRTHPVLSDWVRVDPRGRVDVYPGKVEIGQGIVTALAQIVADELDVALKRVRLVPARTGLSPDEGVTSGSLSVQHCGAALGYAGAEIRGIFLVAAAERLGVPLDTLRIDDGVFRGPGNVQTSYWELADEISLDQAASEDVCRKPRSERRFIGSDIPRSDIPRKVFAARPFIHDIELPDLLHARVLRPEIAHAARLEQLDVTSLHTVDGFVKVVRHGNFVGVLAATEHSAEECLSKLSGAAEWVPSGHLPDEGDLANWLKIQPADTRLVAEANTMTDANVVRTITREYSRPFIAHASIGPSCALAWWKDTGLHVWTHSQGVYNLRSELALVLGHPADSIVVEHAEGAGCYGHNGADDVALDAALLASEADGRPVRLQWTRGDELSKAPFGAAMTVALEAGLDSEGDIATWHHEIWSNGHVARPGRGTRPVLRAGAECAGSPELFVAENPPLANGGGAERNAVPIYDLPQQRVVNNRLLTMPIRTSSLRSLGGFANVFAIESFVDELAAETGVCPVEFRRRYLTDERARTVLDAAASRSDWWDWASKDGLGHGIALARYKNTGAYAAVVAEVEASEQIGVRRLVIAIDVGDPVNPDGVRNQVEGGAIQATSWTIKEAVRFDHERITSVDWESYPILRFSETPKVVVDIVGREIEEPVGAGEAVHGPTAGAIANAVHNALGVRVRHLPINRDSIIKAMEEGA